MNHLYQLVGPNIFRGMMRRHITNAYDGALSNWPGKSFLDINTPLGGTIRNQEGVAAAKKIDPNYL